MTRITAVLIGLCVICATANAQITPDAPSVQRGKPPTCFRPKPLPRCGGFIVFEMEAATPIVSTTFATTITPQRFQNVERYLLWQLGYVHNQDPRRGYGFTIEGGVSGSGGRLGIEARQRRWLGPSASLDVSAGVVSMKVSDSQVLNDNSRAAFTSAASLSVKDFGALTTRVDFAPGAHTAAAVYGGGQLRSTTAIVGSVLLGVLAGVLIYALSQGDF